MRCHRPAWKSTTSPHKARDMKTYRVVSINDKYRENFAIIVTEDDGSERQLSLTFRRRDLLSSTRKHLEQQEGQVPRPGGRRP